MSTGSAGSADLSQDFISKDGISVAYITKYNFENLVYNYRPAGFRQNFREIYKSDITRILSIHEQHFLFWLKRAHEEKNFDFEPQKYNVTKTKGVVKSIFPSAKPAYHTTPKCEKLLSDFECLETPTEILARGVEELTSFHTFCEKNRNLYLRDESEFERCAAEEFDLKDPFKRIHIDNSGVAHSMNYDLEYLEQTIDQLLIDAEKFRHSSESIRDTIDRLGSEGGSSNVAGSPDSPLYIWKKKYRKGLKFLLSEYFKVKLNPEMKFSGSLLDQLGFVPCKTC